jgi:hypothetical protein
VKRPWEVKVVMAIGTFAVVCLTAYWVAWVAAPTMIQARRPDAPDYQMYVCFQEAFPLADAWLAGAALVGVVGLYRRRDWGFLFMLLGFGAAIFLGLMDLLYDIEHSMFVPMTVEGGIELTIVGLTLVLGSLGIRLLWRQRRTMMR